MFFLIYVCVCVLFQATSAPIFRMQENSPQFRLNNLEPGREYQFLVYAVNAKGRSEPPVVIENVRVAAQLGPYGEYQIDPYILESPLKQGRKTTTTTKSDTLDS